jgi:hypothetical protein
MEIKSRSNLDVLLKQQGMFDYPVVEVGVAEGLNSADMLRWGISKLYMVDAWRMLPQTGDGGFEQSWHDTNYQQAVDRVLEFGEKAVILRGLSVEMSQQVEDNSCGLIYLDGDHSYTGVMKDLYAWFQKLKVGGIMAGHDFVACGYGVNQAVHEFCKNKYDIHTIPENGDDASFYFIKTL